MRLILLRTMAWLLASAAVITMPATPATGQAPAGTPPAPAGATGSQTTFKSGVDLIAIDVSIVDKTGAPVRGLVADQFELQVDGRPRRVVSAQLVDYVDAGGGTIAGKEVWSPGYSSNEVSAGVGSSVPGRLMFVVVDEGSFLPSATMAAKEAARRFVTRLQPQDRVGLLTIPAPGKAVGATTNHEAVTEALMTVVGSADPLIDSMGPVSISLSEAVDIASGDSVAFNVTVSRVCAGLRGPDLVACRSIVQDESRIKAQRAEMRVKRTLDGLHAVASAMSSLPERKTLVVVSAGLPAAGRLGSIVDTQLELISIAREASKSNANIYILHIDRTFMEAFAASERRLNPTLLQDATLLGTGLDALAGASGGTLFRISTSADSAFDQVLRESASSYVLAAEPGPADYDGKAHAIKVSVNRPGVVIRSRKEFVLSPRAAAAPTDPLSAALGSPQPATTLPIGVSTRTLGHAESGGLRVLIIANVGRRLPGTADLRIGYRLLDRENRTVITRDEKKRLLVPPSNPDGSASYASLVTVPPGSYTLRIAAVDDAGHSGSVSHAVTVTLPAGEGVVAGDLLLGEAAGAPGGEVAAFADGRMRGRTVGTYLELFGDPNQASTAAVAFSLAERAGSKPLAQANGTTSRLDSAGHSSATGRLDVSLIPPGDYVVAATVTIGQKVVARRTQPLRLEPPLPAAAGAPAASTVLPRVRFVLGPSSGLVGAFSRSALLTPTVLDYVAARLGAADRGPAVPGVDQAYSALRAGDFDAALAALRGAPAGRLSVAFLNGLALFGKGDLEPSVAQFRAAVGVADDFLPAAFYIGACFAAAGKDAEAAGAWQMSLITEDDVRIVYDVLVDALLRQGEAERAVEVIEEARGRWKGDDGFVPRLAVAQAMLGRPAEALSTLGTYLDVHRADAEAAALAVRLIYDARAAGKTVVSAGADRELAEKYGDWYRAAGGEHEALVERWVAFILKS